MVGASSPGGGKEKLSSQPASYVLQYASVWCMINEGSVLEIIIHVDTAIDPLSSTNCAWLIKLSSYN